MTYTWSPAIKEPLQSDVWSQRFDDFMLNWVVTGLTPSDGGSGILDIAAGTCYIDGWRVVTDGETHDISTPDGLRWVYIELTKDGGGRVTSITEADYASEQTEDVRILIAKPTVASGLITDVGDVRQYDTIDSSLIKLDTDVSLSDWRHVSDLTKIDGGDIYAGTILNAMIGAAADIVASKILIDGTTQLSEWRHSSDLTKIDGADIYASSVTDTQLATISWSKISKTGSNLNEIVTRSHTVLSDKGSNTHPTIDTHITTANSHFGDTSDPHGSSMSISTKLTTPRIDNSGNLVLESTANHVYINAPGSGKSIYLTPSGKIYLQDDVIIEGNLQHNATQLSVQNTTGDDLLLVIECTDYNDGGIVPDTHEKGTCGDESVEKAWRQVVGEFLKDTDGNLGMYSERDDLGDLRKVKALKNPETEEYVRGSWGDHIIDASTIPQYIRSKSSWDAAKKRAEDNAEEYDGRAYINNSKWKGWMVSLIKRLDEIDTTQDEKLTSLFDELVAVKSRLDAIEQA